jgi:predicted dehydrogenase
VHQDYVQRPPARSWEVIGDSGRIIADLRQPSVTVIDGRGEVQVEEIGGFERNHLFPEEMRHFLACLDRAETPSVSIRQALDGQRVATAVLASISSGAVIDLV